MKPALLLLSALLLSLSCLAQSKSFDVRNVRWHMTKAQVLAAEKGRKPAESSIERLVYSQVNVGGDIANLLYEFHSNKLVSLSYTFTKLGGILYLPYIGYSAIDRKVAQRYGEPLRQNEKWRVDKGAYSITDGYADAIGNGDLFLSTIWLNSRTEVTHFMGKDAHALLYTSQLTPKPASEESKGF